MMTGIKVAMPPSSTTAVNKRDNIAAGGVLLAFIADMRIYARGLSAIHETLAFAHGGDVCAYERGDAARGSAI